jgi:hypothetical protein
MQRYTLGTSTLLLIAGLCACFGCGSGSRRLSRTAPQQRDASAELGAQAPIISEGLPAVMTNDVLP